MLESGALWEDEDMLDFKCSVKFKIRDKDDFELIEILKTSLISEKGFYINLKK